MGDRTCFVYEQPPTDRLPASAENAHFLSCTSFASKHNWSSYYVYAKRLLLVIFKDFVHRVEVLTLHFHTLSRTHIVGENGRYLNVIFTLK